LDGMKTNERLLYVRNYLGISQRAIAREMGIGRSTYQYMELGLHGIRDCYYNLFRYTFAINSEWLKHGTGGMILPTGRRDEILKMIEQLINENYFKLLSEAKKRKENQNIRGYQEIQQDLCKNLLIGKKHI